MKKQNKEIIKNASWNLELDPVETYAFWENVFTKEECNKIIKIAKSKGLIEGIAMYDEKVRSSKICWLYAADDLVWAFERLTGVINSLNERFFKFDIFGFHEGFQFANYKAPSGKYGKHVDRGLNTQVRKLSLSVQLTDPSKYTGGNLILYDTEKGIQTPREQGTLVVFPSYTLHEVTPVTKGERNSLVSWITGKPFK